MLPWQRHIRQLHYQKAKVCVVTTPVTCLLLFLVTKGSRVLENKLNEAQVSVTVFSHLTSLQITAGHRTNVR